MHHLLVKLWHACQPDFNYVHPFEKRNPKEKAAQQVKVDLLCGFIFISILFCGTSQ